MNLYEQIKAHRIAAIKASDAAKGILTVLVGEIERLVGKEEITDQKVLAIIKKLVASNTEVLQVTAVGTKANVDAAFENSVIEVYIPLQLTEDQIAAIIVANDLNSLKEVMAFMKANYAGLYDGKAVSTLFTKGVK